MFTVEIRVNGSIVTALDAINADNENGYATYKYRLVKFPILHERPLQTRSGKVKHKRADCIESLVSKILNAAVT